MASEVIAELPDNAAATIFTIAIATSETIDTMTDPLDAGVGNAVAAGRVITVMVVSEADAVPVAPLPRSSSMIEPADQALDRPQCLVRSARDGFVDRHRVVDDDGRLVIREAYLHHAAPRVLAGRVAGLVAEVNFHARDAIGESTHRALDDVLDVSDQRLTAFDVVIGVH
jgi:hypothetical protein